RAIADLHVPFEHIDVLARRVVMLGIEGARFELEQERLGAGRRVIAQCDATDPRHGRFPFEAASAHVQWLGHHPFTAPTVKPAMLIGRMTRTKAPKRERPSIIAASSTSLGMTLKKPIISQVQKGIVKLG